MMNGHVYVPYGKNSRWKKNAQGRRKTTDRYKSNLERDYAEYLQLQKLSGQIHDWKYEPKTFWLAKRTTYTPDFLVIQKDKSKEYHEVKGFSRQAGRIKWKITAEQHPEYKWYWVTRKKGRWKLTRYRKDEKRRYTTPNIFK